MIKFEHVTKSYGAKHVLTDINFVIENGKITSLVGKNGAGKSTTINIASKYINASGGTITNHSISVMPDADNLYRDMTGKHFLKFMAKLKKVPTTTEITNLTNELGLSDNLNKKIKDYSFGMKKKIAFIQAYMGNYDTYIFDEPTSGVDYESAEIMMAYLRKLAQRDKAVLLTSHNLDEISEISDHIIFLANGLTVEKQEALSHKTAFLLLTFADKPEQLTALGFKKMKDNVYHIETEPDQINHLLQTVINAKINIKEFKLAKSEIASTLDSI